MFPGIAAWTVRPFARECSVIARIRRIVSAMPLGVWLGWDKGCRFPLTPRRLEIDPRLEILIKTAMPGAGPSRPPGFACSVAAGRRPILHHPGPDEMVGLPRPRFKTVCEQHPPIAQIGF